MGLMASVVIFGMIKGAATPETVEKACTRSPFQQLADIDNAPRYRRRSHHGGAREMRAGLGALAVFEVSIGRGNRPFARLDHIAIAGNAHRAAGVAPLKSRLDEYLVKACC